MILNKTGHSEIIVIKRKFSEDLILVLLVRFFSWLKYVPGITFTNNISHLVECVLEKLNTGYSILILKCEISLLLKYLLVQYKVIF